MKAGVAKLRAGRSPAGRGRRAADGVVARRDRMRCADSSALTAHVADLIAVLAVDRTIRYLNPAVRRLLGFQPAELIGQDAVAFVHSADVGRVQRWLDRARQRSGELAPVELRLRQRDGCWRWFECLATNRLADPDVAGIVVSCRDITVRKGHEAQLRRRAFFDPLTGLPNRALFLDRLARALAALPRRAHHLAVLFLDLDGFKAINDRFGHRAGDRLLQEVGRRLAVCVRPGDTAARLGGDEFVCLVEDVGQPGDVGGLAARILDAVRQPISIEGGTVAITASLGFTLAAPTAAGRDPEALLREADTALYQAKAAGKDRICAYTPVDQVVD